ncbi:MAG TPA: SRPBCC family protein [Leifsonia sp.]|jgi:hypothetical protein|nr:polyketide cyclase [Microbacteriaceae bacterium]HEV7812439.1 SRPBCC family protein [Leifsonia sp.]
MATNTRVLRCSPEDVFGVLADGWLYPSWVVGASRIRDVDESWPAPQSSIQHSFGVWPVLLDDSTYVLEWDPPRRAKLRARGWPIGEAFVLIEVKRRGDGCVVRIVEDAVVGPGKLIPPFLRDIGIHYRNTETLRRLGYLAEGRAGR